MSAKSRIIISGFKMRLLLFILLIFHTLFLFNLGFANQEEEQEIFQLDEISVTPGKFSISERVLSPFIIPKSEMEKLPLIDNDVYRSAHNLPGVVADDFSARFSLRGGGRDEIIVKLDGMELYDPYHLQDFGGAMSVIDMGIVGKADLLTGGFSAEYGDAMSGVFDLTSGSRNPNKIGGNIGIDLLNAHIIMAVPLSDASLLFSARRGYIDLLMGLIDSEEIFKPRFYDIYGKLNYDISSKDRVSAHFLYAGDANEIDRIGDENDINSKYWNGMFWGKWNHSIRENALWNIYAFFGHAGREKYEGIGGVDERWLSYFGFKGDIAYSPVDFYTLKAGWKWQQLSADYNYFLKKDREEISADIQPRGWDMNAYIQDEWRISKRFAGNLGLRFMYQDDGEYFSIMPRIALATKLNKSLTIRTAYGIYNQPVSIINLPVEQGISESQPPEKSSHYILAAEYTPSASFLLRTEAYYKTYDDLVGIMKDYGRKEQFFIPAKSGHAKGLEFYAKNVFSSKFTMGLGYALAKSELDIDIGKIPREHDRRHSITLSADYGIWSDGWINIMWRFHSGEPYTDSWYEKVTNSEGTYSWEKKYGSMNGSLYPAYHSFDVRLTKKFQFKKLDFSLYFQILNLYNRGNVQEYSFEELVDDKGEIYYEKVTENFLPILPAIGLSFQF